MRRARLSFEARSASLRADLEASRTALSRSKAARHRLEAGKARSDMREWAVKRRERTRHLIELGGLVAKAGLDDLVGDDRATLYGAMLTIAERLRTGERDTALALWRGVGEGRLGHPQRAGDVRQPAVLRGLQRAQPVVGAQDALHGPSVHHRGRVGAAQRCGALGGRLLLMLLLLLLLLFRCCGF